MSTALSGHLNHVVIQAKHHVNAVRLQARFSATFPSTPSTHTADATPSIFIPSFQDYLQMKIFLPPAKKYRIVGIFLGCPASYHLVVKEYKTMVTSFNPLSILARNRGLKKSVAECRPRLYRVAYSWTHDPVLADELTQEALSKGLKKLAQVRDPKTVDRWLFGILSNCWKDHFRRTRPTEDIDDYVPLTEHTPEQEFEQQRLKNSIQQAIAELPAAHRQIVTLVDLEGFRYAEVSDILQIPVGTVMSRLCRARKTLAKKLIDYRNDSGRQEAGGTSQIRRIS
jgi:RNA polymerase sigma-70 factor, ECF subfamily